MTGLHPEIPRVLCPSCGSIMRLNRIAPDHDNRATMQFHCECGFDYRMSARARREAQKEPETAP
jgi:RNase P subunit RPR2